MSDKLRENQPVLTNNRNIHLSVNPAYGTSKTLSFNTNSSENSFNYENLNELNSVIRPEKSPDTKLSSEQTADSKNRNRKSLVDALNDSVLNRPNHKHRFETIVFRELLSLGIKRDRLEKALAATGYQNSVDAINWLMKHAKDPILNIESLVSTRDCLLVLCPVGKLGSQISQYFQIVKQKIGSNEAHYNNLLPFMKLTPFFKIPDNQITNLHKAFDKSFKNLNELTNLNSNKSAKMNAINLDLHSSHQMILLYPDVDSENAIRQIAANFNKIAAKYTNYEIIPYSKQLHLTLGFGYEPEQRKILVDLATNCINYRSPGEWEVRLYSRDSRADNKMTFKVISSYKPKMDSELGLKINDYVFASMPSKDNLMKGVSFSTGETGYFPAKNVERVAETDTWKLHKSHQFVGSSSSTNLMAQTATSPGLQSGQFFGTDKSDTRLNTNAFYYSENANMQKFFQLNPHKSMKTQGTLRFFFARHGERIDLAFGPQWIEQAFDRNGKYRRINLNMPTDLPYRPSKREFIGDSPLTEIGQFQARLTGEALGYEGYKIHYCYTSPALRCIQTATQILAAQGLEKVVKIRIEPSIFEFLGWYDKGLPYFVNTESLVAFGFNIDINYKPLLSLERLQQDENYTDYYQRSFNVTKYLSNIHQNEGGNILVVGHAGTLEVCTRQITGMPVRPYAEFNATIRKVPYLGLAMIEKEANSSSFEIQGSVIPALGHTSNFNFDPMTLKL